MRYSTRAEKEKDKKKGKITEWFCSVKAGRPRKKAPPAAPAAAGNKKRPCDSSVAPNNDTKRSRGPITNWAMEENFPVMQTTMISVLLAKGVENVVSPMYVPPAANSSVMVHTKTISPSTLHANLKQFQDATKEHNKFIDHLTWGQVFAKLWGFAELLLSEAKIELLGSAIIYHDDAP